jgi:4-amino-4-deoxy-L-arabinose transferase-like glycosyltransferase
MTAAYSQGRARPAALASAVARPLVPFRRMKNARSKRSSALAATTPPLAPPRQSSPTEGTPSRQVAGRAPFPVAPRRVALLRYGLPLLLAAFLTLGALWPRAALFLDAGGPLDLLLLANVHGDEHLANYAYRWTNKNDQPTIVALPGWAGVTSARVTLRAQALPERGTVPVTLLVAGQPVGALTVDGTLADQTTTITIPASASAGGDLALALSAPTTRVAGDNRDLGVKLDALTVTPLAWDGAAFWRGLPLHLFGALTLVALLMLLIGGGTGRLAVAGRFGTAVLVPLALGVALPWTLAALPALLYAAGAATLVRWRIRALDALALGWAALDRPRVATVVALAGLVVYTAVMLPHILAAPWINHADYADNAVVARNLVRGNGFTVDYVAQFYRDWPTVRHPADTWPPLQPIMIALSFALFGVSVGVAKLPNLLIMLGLLWLVFRVGRWLWSVRVGLLAALFVALDPDLLQGVVYPLNDTAFTLLSFGCIVLVLRVADKSAVGGRRSAEEDKEEATTKSSSSRALFSRLTTHDSRLTYALLGLLGGLLILCKPSGAIILVGGGLWLLWRGWRGGTLRATITGGALAAGVALLVWLPWGVRNLLTFGQPFYSTESFDAWILMYRPWENIYKVYTGLLPLPHPRLLVGYGFDTVLGKVWQQFSEAWKSLRTGEIFPLTVVPLALLGLLAVRGQRQITLLLALGSAILLYALFVLGYWHYEPRYALFLVPWGALFGAAGLWWLHDRLAAWRGNGAIAGLAVIGVMAFVLAPQWTQLRDDWSADLRTPNSVVMAEWVAANTPTDAVIMSRNPWELSFHGDRRSVMIPYDTLPVIRQIAAQYGVGYLQLDHLTDPGYRRADLGPLYDGPDEWNGFRKVYDRRSKDGEGLLIYTFPQGGR